MDLENTQAEDEAQKRRERLKNLRNRIANNESSSNDQSVIEELPKIKEEHLQMNYDCRNSFGQSASNNIDFKALNEKNERLKSTSDKVMKSTSWGNSVIKVIFRDEYFEDKYKRKLKSFLKELLEDDENFILTSQIYDDTKQELIKVPHSMQQDLGASSNHKDKSSKHKDKSSNSVPIYSSEFEGVLHCDVEEKEKDETDVNKPQALTCFNCLGDHHMKSCPKPHDRSRINANMKELMQSSNTSRYHEEEQKNSLKPGNLSSKLREALGLRKDQLPQYIYKMRVVGYPPGWMNEARHETSGISLYDSFGKAVSDDESSNESLENEDKYDSSKFVEFPGFNCPVPPGFRDEWKTLGLVPIQPHQQLSETRKAEKASTSTNKRKHATPKQAVKKSRNGNNSANESYTNWSPENNSTPMKTEAQNHSTPTKPETENCSTPIKPETENSNNGKETSTNNLSLSISQSPGTPILGTGNPFHRLPDANKFAEGITEHMPFENLPDAVGKFEKMRGILSNVQKKLQNIKNES